MNYIYFHRYGGFANSLCIWQFCYELAKINNMQVAMYKYHFPESKYLNFPNTVLLETEPHNYKKLDSNSIKHCNFKVDNSNVDIELTCGWGFSRDLEHTLTDRAVSRITFIDKNLNDSIVDFCKDKIGIHLRRGDHNHYASLKASDEFYYNQCLLDKDSEFYLSTDATLSECKFLDKFTVHKYAQFLDRRYDCVNCHSSGEPKSFKKNIYNINDDLIKIKCIDLFALSNCKKIIGCKSSTFSLIASYMGNNTELIGG